MNHKGLIEELEAFIENRDHYKVMIISGMGEDCEEREIKRIEIDDDGEEINIVQSSETETEKTDDTLTVGKLYKTLESDSIKRSQYGIFIRCHVANLPKRYAPWVDIPVDGVAWSDEEGVFALCCRVKTRESNS